jgi:hypothetical protein
MGAGSEGGPTDPTGRSCGRDHGPFNWFCRDRGDLGRLENAARSTVAPNRVSFAAMRSARAALAASFMGCTLRTWADCRNGTCSRTKASHITYYAGGFCAATNSRCCFMAREADTALLEWNPLVWMTMKRRGLFVTEDPGTLRTREPSLLRGRREQLCGRLRCKFFDRFGRR